MQPVYLQRLGLVRSSLASTHPTQTNRAPALAEQPQPRQQPGSSRNGDGLTAAGAAGAACAQAAAAPPQSLGIARDRPCSPDTSR